MPIRENKERRVFFKKSLGQNILRDLNIIRKIVSSLNVKEDDVILEIGPGLGALTDELIKHRCKVITIEKDTRFYDILKERYKDKNVEVIHADALKYDYSELFSRHYRKIKVVANLPYNVSTEILFLLFSHKAHFINYLLMFQKEVALRITAVPSTKDYGVLSVLSQYHSRPAMILNVPGKCFVPVPKIDSTVVYFDLYERPPFMVRDEELFVSVVKTAFAHRRKTLLNCFRLFRYRSSAELDIEEIFERAAIDLARRGETLSVEEFSRLTESFTDFIDRTETE